MLKSNMEWVEGQLRKDSKMEQDLTTGSITGKLLLFAVPLMIGNVLQQFYNIVDTWIVGKYIGYDALAAVGLFLFYYTHFHRLKVEREYMVWDISILKNIFKLSGLTCLQQSVMNFGILMVQGLVNGFGSIVMAAFYFGIGLLFMLYGFYRGMNRPAISLVLTVCSLGTRVLLAYVLSAIPAIGVTGIWVSIPIGWALADMVGVLYYTRWHVHLKEDGDRKTN